MSGSVSFDRAADYYDATRLTDEVTLARILDLLQAEMPDAALEIGVGTGQLAVPLARRGVRVTGLDLSAAMMAKLRAKAGGDDVPLVRGDATRLPFRDGAVAGAYVRWVLHLIADWEAVLDELIRVVRPGAAIAIEPGGVSGVFREILVRYLDVVGDAVLQPGLHPIDRDARLDAAMGRRGWSCVGTHLVTYAGTETLRAYFDAVPARRTSWTWRVPEPVLVDATDRVRAWAAERFDLDEPLPREPTAWHVYRRAEVTW